MDGFGRCQDQSVVGHEGARELREVEVRIGFSKDLLFGQVDTFGKGRIQGDNSQLRILNPEKCVLKVFKQYNKAFSQRGDGYRYLIYLFVHFE